MKNNLAENLKNLRVDRNLTQSQVASYINISRSTYTYYEIGTRVPSMETILLLSKLFNVSVDTIIKDNGNNLLFRSNTPKYHTNDNNHQVDINGTEDIFNSKYKMRVGDLEKDEQDIVLGYRMLSNENKQKLTETLIEMKEKENRK